MFQTSSLCLYLCYTAVHSGTKSSTAVSSAAVRVGDNMSRPMGKHSLRRQRDARAHATRAAVSRDRSSRSGRSFRFAKLPGRAITASAVALVAVVTGLAATPRSTSALVRRRRGPIATVCVVALCIVLGSILFGWPWPSEVRSVQGSRAGPQVDASGSGGTVGRGAAIAYVADGSDGTVTPISLPAGIPGRPILAGNSPGVIGVAPDGRTVYVGSWEEGMVTPINVATDVPGTPIKVRGTVDGIAIAPDGKTAYVADGSVDVVIPIRLPAGIPGRPIKAGDSPGAIAITPDGKTAYVATADTVIPIRLPAGIPGRPIKTGPEPVAIAITPDGKTAYVVDKYRDTVTPISVATDTPGTPIRVESGTTALIAIAIAPDGKTAYVVDPGLGTVIPLNLASGTRGRPIRVGALPAAIAITPDGKTAYVADSGEGTVTPINLSSGTPGAPIVAGGDPDGIAITPVTRSLRVPGSDYYCRDHGVSGHAHALFASWLVDVRKRSVQWNCR